MHRIFTCAAILLAAIGGVSGAVPAGWVDPYASRHEACWKQSTANPDEYLLVKIVVTASDTTFTRYISQQNGGSTTYVAQQTEPYPPLVMPSDGTSNWPQGVEVAAFLQAHNMFRRTSP
jgi:hypothetical protein